MDMLNSADLRNKLSDVIELVASKKEPVIIGRFGQPKAILMDIITYNWQEQILRLLEKLNKLNSSEIETLNILLDNKARKALLDGVNQAEKGEVVSFEKFSGR